jgi:hypothetical protein
MSGTCSENRPALVPFGGWLWIGRRLAVVLQPDFTPWILVAEDEAFLLSLLVFDFFRLPRSAALSCMEGFCHL